MAQSELSFIPTQDSLNEKFYHIEETKKVLYAEIVSIKALFNELPFVSVQFAYMNLVEASYLIGTLRA